MITVQIIGHQNSGKTTITVKLVQEFVKRGIRVGTIKHSAHNHELDKPGKDSHMHRTAGASPAAMISERMMAVYLPRKDANDPDNLLKRFYGMVDIAIIEGWISGPHPKIEVWRRETGKAPVFKDVRNVLAMVSDDSPDTDLPVFETGNIPGLAEFILDMKKPQNHMD